MARPGTRRGSGIALRSALLVLTCVTLLAACGGDDGLAPVAERSTAAAPSDAGGPRVSAGTEVEEGDWTATVRPLGDAGGSAPRALPGSRTRAQSGTGAVPVASNGASSRINPAVVSLLNTASAQSRAGEHARAAATLERAIAIEPELAWLWHRLAATRLAEGRLEQAAALAAKSSALPSADRSLEADNWKIIAEVRRRQGDARASAAAEAQARKLAD